LCISSRLKLAKSVGIAPCRKRCNLPKMPLHSLAARSSLQTFTHRYIGSILQDLPSLLSNESDWESLTKRPIRSLSSFLVVSNFEAKSELPIPLLLRALTDAYWKSHHRYNFCRVPKADIRALKPRRNSMVSLVQRLPLSDSRCHDSRYKLTSMLIRTAQVRSGQWSAGSVSEFSSLRT
jgi:hypothetical protein